MTQAGPVAVTIDGDIAWVEIDSPPVNATSAAVRKGLMDAVETVTGAGVKAAVLSCAGRTFIAGGDMSEFDAAPVLPHLPDVVDAIEHCPAPWLALLHGTTLGGGYEVAMGCAWRFAAAGTKIGLPEVNVGIVPGAGGTQRLPRLVGPELAADMCSSGAPQSADALLKAGGIDQIITGDLKDAARAFVADLPVRPVATSQRSVSPAPDGYFDEKRAAVKKRAKGSKAPIANVDAVEWACQSKFEDGQPRERRMHLDMRVAPESKSLRHAFFAERLVAKPSDIDGVTPRSVQKVAIVGGGLMGAGIATACLGGGLDVTIIEQNDEAAATAHDRVVGLMDGALQRGKISQEKFDDQVSRLTAAGSTDAAADADMAIEAVFEDLDVKRNVFKNLAAVMDDNAILASNTSYIDPAEIFVGLPNLSRCIGLHFFSPAHIMKLLEIVKTPDTAADVIATGFALGKKLRKVSVLSGICDGFIGNRMLAAYRREADYLLADGCLPFQIDAAIRAFGMPMGPYELQDLTGLQISWANRKRQAPNRDPKERYVTIADQLCEMDRLGQRSGKGWYLYEEGNRKPVRDASVDKLVEDYSAANGITRHDFSDEDIVNRLMAAMINEGARIVEEGIAERMADVDMVKVHGYAFPRWRGGPMFYGELTGWDKIADSMKQVAQESPNSWKIAGVLAEKMK